MKIEFMFDVHNESTCSEEIPNVVCAEITTPGTTTIINFRMTPSEARELGELLIKAADEADADEER